MASGRGVFVHSLMLGILPLECPVQHYDWGSRAALGRLLGRRMSGRPEAELWMGAHPTAPSVALLGSRRVALDRLIAEHPVETLGRFALDGHGATLPFLFKVLALGKPVSVQAHPTRARAVGGFETEQLAGVPLDAPHRSYRDRGHKPEIVVALEPMVVLSGVRPLHEIEAALTAAGVGELAALAAPAGVQDAAGAIRRVLRATLTLDDAAGTRLHRRLVDSAARDAAEGALLATLADHYPGDPTVIAALLLNPVELAPGEALYTPPGQLHAFVSGAGIELMANSDNVLRAGLTSKHVDVDELLAATDLRPGAPGARPAPGGGRGRACLSDAGRGVPAVRHRPGGRREVHAAAGTGDPAAPGRRRAPALAGRCAHAAARRRRVRPGVGAGVRSARRRPAVPRPCRPRHLNGDTLQSCPRTDRLICTNSSETETAHVRCPACQ